MKNSAAVFCTLLIIKISGGQMLSLSTTYSLITHTGSIKSNKHYTEQWWDKRTQLNSHFLHDSWSVLQEFIARHYIAEYWNRIGQARWKVGPWTNWILLLRTREVDVKSRIFASSYRAKSLLCALGKGFTDIKLSSHYHCSLITICQYLFKFKFKI